VLEGPISSPERSCSLLKKKGSSILYKTIREDTYERRDTRRFLGKSQEEWKTITFANPLEGFPKRGREESFPLLQGHFRR